VFADVERERASEGDHGTLPPDGISVSDGCHAEHTDRDKGRTRGEDRRSGAGDDVHELRGPDDDPFDAPAIQDRGHPRGGQRLATAALFVGLRTGVRDVQPLMVLLSVGVQMNVLLAIFNLVPLPPLDGSWVASWGLPRPIGEQYDRIVEPYGQWILLALFATGALGFVLSPFIRALSTFLFQIARSSH
jgi:hypothetical protein